MGPLRDRRLLMFLVISCFIFVLVECEVKKFHFLVKNISWNPDGVQTFVLGSNNQFPGPVIRANVGDTVHVNLTNGLTTEGTAIHWHGIRQFNTSWADGTAYVTQCPILPGESFVYKFKVDKLGTYFYHGHYRMQRTAGLYGFLVVDGAKGKTEPLEYYEDRLVLLSDWWHKSVHEQEDDLDAIPMSWIGEPQTLLINGRGQSNCFLDAPPLCNITGGEQYAPDILQVEPNKKYRIRVASATSLASLHITIQNHTLQMVESDANLIEPFNTTGLYIYPGETCSFLINTHQNPEFKTYWLTATVIGREPKTPPALTLLSYNISDPLQHLPKTPPPPSPAWNNTAAAKNFSNRILALNSTPPPPPTADQTIILLNTQNLIDGRTKWALNNISLDLPSIPYLAAIKYSIAEAFDHGSLPNRSAYLPNYNIFIPPPNPNATLSNKIYWLGFNSTVDVILQNANVLSGVKSEVHPWHLHGHDFWVLGYGDGKFSEKDKDGFNLKNPPAKFTAVLFPYGWTALRFVADNPGAWAFHCHIEPHMHMGMGVVFAEGVHQIGYVPEQWKKCGTS